MSWATLTFIGSGEFSPTMGPTYRAVLRDHTGPVRGVFLDTPAGFELNADQITAKALAYFEQRAALKVSVASLRSVAAATPEALARCTALLDEAHFVFAGPGSPTYAARVWRALDMGTVLRRRLQTGAHMVFASAAAIAASCCALPVYEIYKVGQDPYWADGLDLLGPLGLSLAVVPHWNNAEGGTHDTAYCYLGAERFIRLEAQLPANTVLLGIDEYTAITLDLGSRAAEVSGAGGVVLRHRGSDGEVRERRYAGGRSFDLDELTPGAMRLALPAPEIVKPAPPPEEAVPDAGSQGDLSPYIDLLVRVRARLRSEKQWALADQIRDELTELGVRLTDEPDGTRWTRVEG